MGEQMARFNVLAITPTPTHVTNRGNRKRIHAVLDGLRKRGARIHVAYFPREWGMKIDKNEYELMKSEWDEVFIVHPSKTVVNTASGEEYQIDDWWDNNIGSFVNWLSWSTFFDIVIVNYAFFSKAFDYLDSSFLKVLDTHDVLAGRKQMLSANGLPVDFFYTTSEQERIALERSDLIVAIKDSEAEYFKTQTHKPVVVLGHFEKNYTDSDLPRNDLSLSLRIGYIASENPINIANIKRFAQAFLKETRGVVSPPRLIIAGLICEAIKNDALFRNPIIDLRGKIDSISQFYNEDVDVIISPFDFGTGLKIKTVEAITFGKPVMGTKHAFEGIETDEPQHQFASVGDLAKACAGLSQSSSIRLDDLRKKTTQIQVRLAHRFDSTLDFIVETARKRRCVFVTDIDFWNEAGVIQLRAARIVRELSRICHVHVAYVGKQFKDMSEMQQAWQWGTSFHNNQVLGEVEHFVNHIIETVNPSIVVTQTPLIIRNIDQYEFFFDISDLTLDRWSYFFSNHPSIYDSKKLIQTNYHILDQQPRYNFSGCLTIPMTAFNCQARIGSGVAVIVSETDVLQDRIFGLYEGLIPCQRWDGRFDIFHPFHGEIASIVDGRLTYYQESRRDLNLGSRYRICIDLLDNEEREFDIYHAFSLFGVPALSKGLVHAFSARIGPLTYPQIAALSFLLFESEHEHRRLVEATLRGASQLVRSDVLISFLDDLRSSIIKAQKDSLSK